MATHPPSCKGVKRGYQEDVVSIHTYNPTAICKYIHMQYKYTALHIGDERPYEVYDEYTNTYEYKFTHGGVRRP